MLGLILQVSTRQTFIRTFLTGRLRSLLHVLTIITSDGYKRHTILYLREHSVL